ncbi:MAG: AAA family ATPase [Solirubrobacterales bacterium]
MYFPRILDSELRRRLEALGAVLIEGPKASGKTETARQIARSEVLLDIDLQAREAASIDPSLVLEGETPRLIDEWQLVPELWNHVRREVDRRAQPGQFILTGSAVPAEDESRHTGAGRITRIQMRPMSLLETSHSDGSISLESLLDGRPVRSPDTGVTLGDLAARIAVGGWPAIQGLEQGEALHANRSYLDEVRRVDINRVGTARRDPERVAVLLRSLARNVATYASVSTLAADTGGGDDPLKRDTVGDYLDALRRLKVREDQPAWAPHLRSRHALRSQAKRHFVCPSLAVAALRGSPQTTLDDLSFLGFLFESLVVRDLRIYAQAADAEVLQYKDQDLEVDAVVQAVDGRWAAFEIKLGQNWIDEGARNLLKLAKRVDSSKTGAPSALVVITGSGYGYVRDDGISVVPVGALGP